MSTIDLAALGDAGKSELRDDHDRGERMWSTGATSATEGFEALMRVGYLGPRIPKPLGRTSSQLATWRGTVHSLHDEWRQEIRAARQRTQRVIQDPGFRVVIPCREDDEAQMGVPGPCIDGLIEAGLSAEQIVVVDHRNQPFIGERARERGVLVVNADAVMECLNPRVEEVLGGHTLELGKGVSIFCGVVALAAMNDNGLSGGLRHVMWCDAELIGMQEYDPAHYLAYALASDPEPTSITQVLQTHVKRGNEAVKAMFHAILRRAWRSGDHRRIARATSLIRIVHPCAGERIVRWDLLESAPFGHHYTVEHTLNWYLAGQDQSAGTTGVRQVCNPNARVDGSNRVSPEMDDTWVEQRMMFEISAMYDLLDEREVDFDGMSLDDIARLNRVIASYPAVLPQDCPVPGAVGCVGFGHDRIIPSVSMLREHGLIDMGRVHETLQRSSR